MNQDLHKIEKFAQETMAFNEIHFGGASLMCKLLSDDVRVSDMQALELPASSNCQPADRANLRTLVSLLSKARTLRLEQIS